MEQYIPKSALVAEINRQIELLKPFLGACAGQIVAEANAKLSVLEKLNNLLDTLEVKEVDLDYIKDELDRVVKIYKPDGDFGWGTLYNVATHFFELGLKAQHDNWKVVDNTNHPQEDRTKIYCVFTKNRYILAKVISHPQDDDLLQWKCTEFPNHRYDMCEGDKYMQIV